MQRKPPRLRRAICQMIVANVIFSLALIACSDSDSARWTEEVRSLDGSIFQLAGYAERGKSGFPLEHRGALRVLTYYHTATGAYWNKGPEYRPIVFDLIGGQPVVVISVANVEQCRLFGYPPSSILAFQWTSRGWEQARTQELPIQRMSLNLLGEVFHREKRAKDAKGFVSLAEKREREPGVMTLSEALPRWGTRCEDLRKELTGEPALRSTDVVPVLTGMHGDSSTVFPANKAR